MDTSQLGNSASDIAAKSRSFVSAQLNDRSSQVGSSLSSTAEDLRRIAGELRNSETISGSADFAERGADIAGRIGTYLTDSDGEKLISDAEDFARQRPWSVALTALAVGFAASRVLKASSAQRYRDAGYGD